MANSNGWGDGASNNNIGWGKGADNAIGWGSIHADSWAGLTDIVGTPAVDPDAQAFITAASITDPTQQSAINTLVTDLKGYNIWTKMKALYPFVGGTAAQHKWNLKDPRDLDAAFRLVFNGGGTHSVNGFQPNGINGSANTFLNPSITLGLNNSGMSFYSRENKVTACLMGSGGGGGVSILMIPDFGNNVDYSSVYGEGFRTPVQSDKRGLFTVSRISSANEQGYRNGVQYYNNNNTSIARPNASILIGARNLSQQYSNVQCAFSAIHDGLTDTEAANLYTAVQAFQVTLGRSIGTQTVSDADAQAFVTNAGIVDQVEANAVNNLVIGLKADGLWTKMKALYPMVGGSSSTMKYNLKNPLDTDAAFRLVFNGGWTFSSNGATPNGTNGYADTKFNAFLLSQSLTSSHLTYYQRGVSDSGTSRTKIGAATNDTIADGFAIGFFSAGTREVGVVGSFGSAEYAPSGASVAAQGLFMINTNGNRNAKHWKNGIANGAAVTQTGAMPNFNIYLASLNSSSPTPYYHNKQCAFASIGDGLTDTEAANLYTIIQNMQTALNRNV